MCLYFLHMCEQFRVCVFLMWKSDKYFACQGGLDVSVSGHGGACCKSSVVDLAGGGSLYKTEEW